MKQNKELRFEMFQRGGDETYVVLPCLQKNNWLSSTSKTLVMSVMKFKEAFNIVSVLMNEKGGLNKLAMVVL